MTLEQARKESDYSEATIVVNNICYTVDGDGTVTSGVFGFPTSIIDALPESIALSDEWEAVGEAEA